MGAPIPRRAGTAGPLVVGGHDIGGAVAQHLAAHESRVEALVSMNSVLYDSWPVPAVARFRDSAVADAVTVEELLEARQTLKLPRVQDPPE